MARISCSLCAPDAQTAADPAFGNGRSALGLVVERGQMLIWQDPRVGCVWRGWVMSDVLVFAVENGNEYSLWSL